MSRRFLEGNQWELYYPDSEFPLSVCFVTWNKSVAAIHVNFYAVIFVLASSHGITAAISLISEARATN